MVTNVTNPVTNVTLPNNDYNKLQCKYCYIEFNNRQTKWRHEKVCDKENPNQLIEIKKENAEMKKEIEELKNMLQKALKIHPKTLQKINKQLNANNMNNGTINNNITNTQIS